MFYIFEFCFVPDVTGWVYGFDFDDLVLLSGTFD